MKKVILVFIITISFILLFRFLYRSSPPTTPVSSADLLLFWGIGCPHCETVKDFINQNQINQKISISLLEVYQNSQNLKLLQDTVKNCPEIDTSQGIGVPLAYDVKSKQCFIGDIPIIDWLKSI